MRLPQSRAVEVGRLMLRVLSAIRPGRADASCEVPHAGTWLESQPESGRHRVIGYGLAFRSPSPGTPKVLLRESKS